MKRFARVFKGFEKRKELETRTATTEQNPGQASRNHFEKWLCGKPPLVSAVTRYLTANVEKTHEEIVKAFQQNFPDFGVKIRADAWRRLYRTNGRVVHRMILPLLKPLDSLPDFRSQLAWLQSSFRPETLHAATAGLERLPDEQRRSTVLALGVFAQYAFRVMLPCFLAYETHPAKLLRKARQGDMQSLCDLLRLDKSMIGEPRIYAIWHGAMQAPAESIARELLLEAISGKPQARLKRARLKTMIAAMIWLVSDIEQYEMTTEDLRAGFDAIAKDAGRSLIDTELQIEPRAFYQAVFREREILLRPLGVRYREWSEKWRRKHRAAAG